MDGSLVSPATTAAHPGGAPGSGVAPHLQADVCALFLQLLPSEFLTRVRQAAHLRENSRVYTLVVVLWLMITQRLQGNAPMGVAVLELLRGLPAAFWPTPCKRLRDWQTQPQALSSHDGAYNKARQRVPVAAVAQCADQIFEQLIARTPGAVAGLGRRAFFFDGTTMRTAHADQLCAHYPPGANQYRVSHWPLLRVLMAHDVYTGLALRPEWGPAAGADAVSEQALLERAIVRLPPGAVVVGDGNFGVFSVAWAADQRQYPVLLRLTEVRARYLLGAPLHAGIDRVIEWRPSADDRKNHPALPPTACVRGRLVVQRVQPNNGAAPFLLALFTTLRTAPVRELLTLYGDRWHIETDLRTLKTALHMEDLTCKTPAMVDKEILLAGVAYNLVRAVMCLAAQQSGHAPRRFSFTRVRQVVNAFLPLLATARDAQEAARYTAQMEYYLSQCTLPRRQRPRPTYPREVWGKPQAFPRRKA